MAPRLALLFLLAASPLMAQTAPAAIPAAPAPDTAPKAWPPNSMDRPRPPVVEPGPPGAVLPRPSDAIVLFDGKDLSAWAGQDSGPARWTVERGYMEVRPGAGAIHTRRAFGDVQLHIEWAAPAPPTGEGQDRGNSGVFLMGRYEIQVLDSWRSVTYADGQAGALYGQSPPLVNASRPPGQWQSYDIIFHAPRFAPDSTVLAPARATVFHNGVLVQDNVSFTGATVHGEVAVYHPHPAVLSLALQDHGHRVRFRNIWIRPLAARD